MKFYETQFEEYIKSAECTPLHSNVKENISSDFNNLNNLIIYGPAGVGKYTQALRLIKNYSPTNLKYEKKMIISWNKNVYYFKISDIHYEIDMSLLGCTAKVLWHEIYNQIEDSISAKSEKMGIILCKYFHEIHNELLEIFYSYMQKLYNRNINIKFIFLTESISFLPENITNYCKHIKMPRPTRSSYNKCLKTKLKSQDDITIITNIKDLKNSNYDLMQNHKIVSDQIIEKIIDYHSLKYLNLRELLYDICIFDLNILNCIWYILSELINKNLLNKDQLNKILMETYPFFKYYNNNYRPIYHLERYILYIVAIVHEL